MRHSKEAKAAKAGATNERGILLEDYWILIEALSSCAIEGNKWAEEMLTLSKADPEKFMDKMVEKGLLK